MIMKKKIEGLVTLMGALSFLTAVWSLLCLIWSDDPWFWDKMGMTSGILLGVFLVVSKAIEIIGYKKDD